MLLLIQKQKSIVEDFRKKKLKDKFRPHLYEYLFEGKILNKRLVEQKDVITSKAVEEVLNEYRLVTKSSTVEERIKQCADDYLKEYYIEFLENRRWSLRMNTLYSIERFQITALRSRIWISFKQMKEMNSEKQQMARILATFQCNDLMRYMFKEDNKISLHLYKELLRRYSSGLFEEIVNHYEIADIHLKIAILAIIAENKDISYSQLVERELTNKELDIRLQALKVIRNIGYVRDISIIIAFAGSSKWQERMLFCQTSVVLKKERCKPLLIKLISDKNWWVRNCAGEALSKYSDGNLLLEHIAETHNDYFARDMARKWLGSDINA